jgi:XTP/dITP diphosphohydrolase
VARLRLVVASANPDKVAEIGAILGDAFELVPRPADVPDVVEDAPSLEGNARLKAVAISKATGLASVADDTGLEVPVLGGAPGVYSARYSGEHATYEENVAKLLRELDRIGAREAWSRRALFRTVALMHDPNGDEVVAEGIVSGSIALEPRGTFGFGYDPVFIPDHSDGSPGSRTFAELSSEEKHAISHRGRAFRSLASLLA